MRKKIAAANWKMNLRIEQAGELLNQVCDRGVSLQDHQLVVFAVPFPYLIPARDRINGIKNNFVAAQNCSHKASGAYTGEVSADMLQSLRIPFVVLGHSERREYFLETNAMLADKLNLALAHGIQPIFCCGEPLSVREQEKQASFVEQQLRESLFHLSGEQVKNIIIAYEPIWAIGTGKTASAQQAQDMHAHIRSVIASKFGNGIAGELSILYGGSVKGSNAREIFSQPDVDGGLVGGASLLAEEFIQIIQALP